MEKLRILFALLLSLVLAESQLFLGNTTNAKMSATNPKSKTKRESYSPQYDFTSSSNNNMKRKFAVPKGTSLTLTPALSLPIIPKQEDASIQFDSTMKMSFPMTITFNDMSLGFLGESLLDPLFIQKKSLWSTSKSPYYHNSFGNEAFSSSNHIGGGNAHLQRKIRELFSANSGNHTLRKSRSLWKPNCESRSLSDRKMILQKLEMILSTGFGFTSPKNCLLRAVCELHEVPKVVSGFGLVGEYVMLTLSLKQVLEDCKGNPGEFFTPFVEAEVAGKAGRCKIYRKKCDKSLFTFY